MITNFKNIIIFWQKARKPNPKSKSYPNGCGPSFSIDFEKYGAKGFTKCCNSHDICYENCSSNRTDCDEKNHKCLKNACSKILQSDSSYLEYTGMSIES